MATLEDITERLKRAVEEHAGLGKTVKFDFRGDGFIHIDGAAVSNDDKPADCTFDISKPDFEALAQGRLDPATAMMRGRLKVRGDMAVAMTLGAMLARARP